MDEIREKLDGEIEACLNTMKAISPDDDKYQEVMETLGTLYKFRIEEEKLELDRDEKEARREIDIQRYEAELESNEKMEQEKIDADVQKHREEMEIKDQQNKISRLGIWIPAGIAGVTLIFNGIKDHIMYKEGMKFEETGAVTSHFFRLFLNGLFKRNK